MVFQLGGLSDNSLMEEMDGSAHVEAQAYQEDFIPSATGSLQAGSAQMPHTLSPTKTIASKH